MMKTKLYDKRDAFKFAIVRMPFMESCSPERIFYATTMSEILRIARASTQWSEFKSSAKVLLRRMKVQGADEERMRKQMRKMMDKQSEVFQKFGDEIEEHWMTESE